MTQVRSDVCVYVTPHRGAALRYGTVAGVVLVWFREVRLRHGDVCPQMRPLSRSRLHFIYVLTHAPHFIITTCLHTVLDR